MPTLVVHSRRDARVPFDEGRRLAALIPGARFLALESANHVLLEVEPAFAVFVEALYDFIGATAASPAAGTTDTTSASLAPLTGAEAAVLELLARGLDNHAIARQLGKSEKTVRNQALHDLRQARRANARRGSCTRSARARRADRGPQSRTRRISARFGTTA